MKIDFDKFRNNRYVNKFLNFKDSHYILFYLIVSFVINLFIELTAKMSFVDLFSHMIFSFLYFLNNTIIIFITYLLALLFKRRNFSTTLVSILWIAAGITNAFLFQYRHTPFIAADFLVLKSALGIIHIYLNIYQLILMIVAIIGAIVLLVFLFIKERKKKAEYKKIIILFVVCTIFSAIVSNIVTIKKAENEDTNLTQEATEYGFVCCFVNSFLNSGIDKPNVYSKNSMKSISKIVSKKNNTVNNEELPNIILVQLESFIDPYRIEGVEFSQDPTPVFRYLKNTCTQGLLDVAVFGGGTANTEFEVLTGMNLQYFGIGEYPFETILTEFPVESAAYNLKEYGYKTHAYHNHTGTFYDRNNVYKNLGFDDFTCLEYMNDVTYNFLGWEKSDVFTNLITDTIEMTPEKDFMFVVTSQCHGKYPEKPIANSKIKVTNPGNISEIKYPLQFYVNELYEEDVWLNYLIETLKKVKEPTMLILFGDHWPAVSRPEELIVQNGIYRTEYVIWTNYESEKKDKNLSTYNLMSYALDDIGINSGFMTKLHQYEFKHDIDCQNEQNLIQYDMIYGNKYLFPDGTNPLTPSDMKMGIYDIEIDSIELKSKTIVVKGKNFTPWSQIYLDGDKITTRFINENSLRIKRKEFESIHVSQVSNNGTVLSSTKDYLFEDLKEN